MQPSFRPHRHVRLRAAAPADSVRDAPDANTGFVHVREDESYVSTTEPLGTYSTPSTMTPSAVKVYEPTSL